jgi:hypothetical protein
MADFKIGRLRYTWRGNWTTATDYNKDDVVRFGSGTWVCIRQHTSSAFQDDLDFTFEGYTEASPAWVVMTDGYLWQGDWESGTLYSPGDIVNNGGTLYSCITSHTSSLFEEEEANWDSFISAIDWRGNWSTSIEYGVGDIVKYNGIVYKCINSHTSADNSDGLELNQADWEIYYEGIEYKGAWAADTRYRKNDIVKFGGTLFRCTSGHTSEGNTLNTNNFQVELYGYEFDSNWSSEVYYNTGDVVKHGGNVYIALQNNNNADPGEHFTADGSNAWTILAKGVNLRGDWDVAEFYKTGDVVRRGGVLYIAKRNVYGDGSTLGYLNSADWEVVVTGDVWKNYWEQETDYIVGDLVLFDGSAYRCSQSHISSDQNYPGDNGSGYDYWDLLLLAADNTGFTQKGDLLTFGLSRRLAGDGSTFEVTNVPIGNETEFLRVGADNNIEYSNFGNEYRVFYVATDGIDTEDDPDRGLSELKPFRTIRFAAERANDNSGINTTIFVKTGTYEEVLPIIVPRGTVIQGDETRANIIKPKSANPLLANDSAYTISVLNRLSGFIPVIVQNNVVTPSESNTAETVQLTRTVPVLAPDGTPTLDFNGDPLFQTVELVGNQESADACQDLIADIIQYINYHVNGIGTDPVLSGSNDISTDQYYLDTADILLANLDFFTAEAIAWMNEEYSSYSFDSASCARDARRYIEAIAYDIKYAGNYKSLLAGRYYRNAVNGSEGEDMFYCRDASGVRNFTMDGLEGFLNPANVFDLYRRPTGGAYISLDPGWGPDHEECWISTRSPYIQNCCTFGYGCTGQRIDGSLHNGGNKSIVSNDFTQIISDGIGAHVLNNGRAELVSIFTYYAQVGYLAETGGVIRATNGNCSYGSFGAIASGNDPTETPKYGLVNNRTEHAQVADAFAGEVNDEILILQYENAGIGYTQANATFIGSGVSADVEFEDFRDNACYDVRIIDPPDSGGPGGGGFTSAGNNAQAGNLTTITLATNDDGAEADYLGLRIIITSGTGTGQYGIVSAYDSNTKVLNVVREEDNEPGWSHVTPGWPLALVLDTSTTYRLEPRPVFTEPDFNSYAINLNAATNWKSIVYGETSATYTNVAATAGTGDVETQDGLSVTPATFNVTRTGRNYSISIVSRGAGYAEYDEVTILGSLVGGIDGDNDIHITVTAVSDDSTNTIESFVYHGTGVSGTFVATAAIGATTAYSSNGIDWELGAMPTSGDWSCLAAGDGKFVSIRNGSNRAASSNDGITWTTRTMPTSASWNGVAYGDGVFVAVAGNGDIGAFSTNNGTNWSSTSLPDLGDSSFNEWVSIAYGKGKFVAVANTQNIAAVGEWNGTSITWTATIMDVIDDSSQKDWVKVTYGNNRFVAMSAQGDVGYSFDGIRWEPSTMPSQDGSTIMNWSDISYGQGLFVAVCDTAGQTIGGDDTLGPTKFIGTSTDGIHWVGKEVSTAHEYHRVAFGNPDYTAGDSTISSSTGTWVALPKETSQYAQRIYTGARLTGRCIVETGRVTAIRIWDPGSGYITNTPELTIVDPNNTSEVFIDPRIGYGVLAQPSWKNRGVGYKTSTTSVVISGDGYADIIPTDKFITIQDLERYPSPGAQFRFEGNDTLYTVVTITELGLQANGKYSAYFRIDPGFEIADNMQHLTRVEIRERYSQCRITGHDFLDVGTGNFLETNYPEIYNAGLLFVTAPEDEITEANGGRIFYTSTDQSGNFRCGELFSVEQATGIVTISADFFDLGGLTELALGGVRLGGSGAVVREFSTDPLFTEDSNNVVPTQRAIKAYLANRLSIGGSELTTASFIAGTIKVGPDEVRSTISGLIRVIDPTDFSGAVADASLEGEVDRSGEVSGMIVAQNMFMKSFGDDPSRIS